MRSPRLRLTFVFAMVAAAFLPLSRAEAGGDIFVVSKTADTNDGICDADCSLREAIVRVNAGAISPTIDVPAGVYVLDHVGPGEDASATGDLDLLKNVVIVGAGAGKTVIDGYLADRVIDVPFPGPSVSLIGVTVRNGRTVDAGGAGIRNKGTLGLQTSVLRGNKDLGSGSTSIGGGILSTGSLTAVDDTFSNNRATRGGGLFVNGTANLLRVTISANKGVGGGGLVNYGTLVVTTSTVAGNTATAGAGAFHNAAGAITIASSTIASNGSGTMAAIRDDPSGVSISDSIVSGNSALNCQAPLTSNGFNVEDTDTCGFSEPTDHPDTDPSLQALAANGGRTRTMALPKGSPALDLGATECGRDQRGMPRPQGGSCDAGSYELALCASRPVDVIGTNGPDEISGTSSADVIFSLGGADVIRARAGNDRSCGGVGNDTLYGQGGDDTLVGGPDTDTCDGGVGVDAATTCETELHIP